MTGMKKVLVVLLLLMCGWTLPINAATLPSAQVGQNISILLKGLVLNNSSVHDFGCNVLVLVTGYAISKDADWNVVQVYKARGQASNIFALVFDENSDPVMLYAGDKTGKILRTYPSTDLPDDGCDLL